MSEELEELERALAVLFLTEKELPPLTFSKKLTELITEHPEILDYAMQIPPEDPASFLLLSLEKVFNYSFCYRHPVYKPYIPANKQELNKCEQVLKKHFFALHKPLLDFFHSLSRGEEAEIENIEEDFQAIGKDENAPKTTPVKKMSEVEPEVEINNNTLLELWQIGDRQKKSALDKELPEGFPLWFYGVVQDMYRSWFLYQKFQQKGCYKFAIEKKEYSLFPEHEILRLVVGLEYYWVFNRRGVEPDKGLTILQLKNLMQQHINTIYNVFLLMMEPENADILRENPWFIERIKGTKQAKQVSCRYSNYKKDYMIECSDLNAFIQKVVKTEKEKPAEEKAPEKKGVPAKLYETKDTGLSEKNIWELYARGKDVKPDWSAKLVAKMSPVGREILKNMRKSFAIYKEFQNNPKRIIIIQNDEIQPHHLCVHLILFIEYFWQLNVLELSPPESLQKYEIDDLHRRNIQAVLGEMIDLLPPEHSFLKARKEQTDSGFDWLYQKLRGAPGANKITLSATHGEIQYLAEVSAGSASIKKVNVKPLLAQS
jgi:hypothetical protein